MCYERYPAGTVILSNLFAFAIYASGAFILAILSPWLSLAFVLYCLALEVRVLKVSCTGCYYYGRVCAFGKGRLAPLLFERADQALHTARTATWKDVLPELLVPVLSLLAGVASLVIEFRWLVLALLATMVVLSSAGNAFVRGRLACRFCRQREIGCPAQKLFGA